MDSTAAAESSEDPRLLAGYPAARNVAPKTADIVFSTNKSGTIYWALTTLMDGSVDEETLVNPSAYSAKIIKNGTVKVGTSKTEMTTKLSGLTVDGSYYLSAILEDSRGRRSGKYSVQDGLDLIQVDWDGNIVWKFDRNEYIEDPGIPGRWMARSHHDYQREGSTTGYYAPGMEPKTDSGNTLVLAHRNARNPKISDKQLLDDVILEVDWDGDIVWEWNCNEHFDEMGFREGPKNTLARDPNYRQTQPEGMGDWMHINSMSVLGPNKWYDAGDERFHPDNIIVDGREANIIFIISKATGKIVWKHRPDYETAPKPRPSAWIIGQHHCHMVPRGLPGEGNILIFDKRRGAATTSPNPGSPPGVEGRPARPTPRRWQSIPWPAEKSYGSTPPPKRASSPRWTATFLQPLHQRYAAPAQRQHPDHRGLRRARL